MGNSMGKVIAATLAATVALFIWGAVFWMGLAGAFTDDVLKRPPDEEALAVALKEQLPSSGFYYLPADDSDAEVWVERHRRGPVAGVFLLREGVEPMAPAVFAKGVLVDLLTVLVIVLLLRRVVASLGTYGARVGFVTLIGVGAAVFISGSQAVWWYHPWSYELVQGAFTITSFAVVGAVVGWFITPAEAA